MSSRPLPNPFQFDPLDQANPSSPQSSKHESPAGGSGSGPGGGGGPSKPTYAKRGKITIVACVPCRKRKTKCDGKRPSCSQCAAREGTCSYDMSDDQRKLTYLRDNVEQLQAKAQTLQSLLYTVQTASDGEAAEIFRRIRSGTDVNVVAEQVQAGQLLFGVGGREPDQPSQRTDPPESARERQLEQLISLIADSDDTTTMDVLKRLRTHEDASSILEEARLGRFDKPAFTQGVSGPQSGVEAEYSGPDHVFGMMRVTDVNDVSKQGHRTGFVESRMEKSWTNVTQDKALIEHLLTLYFTWQHSFFQNFPERLFRHDYEAGRTKYCSEMLVNAICANGCYLAADEKIRSMMSKFFDEGQMHMKQMDSPHISNTAAMYLMSYMEGTRARLSSLWMLSGRSVLIAVDLSLHLSNSQEWLVFSDDPEERKNEVEARCHAFWGAFHVDQLTSFTLGRLALFNVHSITADLPPVDEEADKEPWHAYEMDLPDRPGMLTTTFRHCTALSLLINSTLMMFNAPTVSLSGNALLEQYQKYQDWLEQLPASISLTYNAPPHVITLHMYYHCAVLSFFRPFLKATIAGSSIVPREVCRNSANAISDLWHQHRALYGLAGIYMFQVHCLLTACTIHIINVPTISSTRYFTHACNTFQDLIPRTEWARSCLKIMRALAEKWSLILPLEAEEALYRDVGGSRNPDHEASSPGVDPQNQMRPPRQAQMLDRSIPFAHHPAVNARIAGGPTAKTVVRAPAQPFIHTSGSGQLHSMQAEHGSASESMQIPTKRSSAPGQLPNSPQATGQKRQRVVPFQQQQDISEQQAGSSTNINQSTGGIPSMTTSSSSQSRRSSQGQSRVTPSASSYLYTPFANQPAPLLNPAGVTTRSASRRVPNDLSTSADDRSTTHSAQVGEQDEDEVDGLSFSDDWRDPFMGYNTHT